MSDAPERRPQTTKSVFSLCRKVEEPCVAKQGLGWSRQLGDKWVFRAGMIPMIIARQRLVWSFLLVLRIQVLQDERPTGSLSVRGFLSHRCFSNSLLADCDSLLWSLCILVPACRPT